MKDARGATWRGQQTGAAVRPHGGCTGRALLFALGLAIALLSARSASAQLSQPLIILLSQTARGMTAEGRSEAPAVDRNGLVTAYSSDAIDLVSPPLQTARNQVYGRDVEVVTSQLLSQAQGLPGNRPSQDSGFPPGISDDGRFVAFSSAATNLVTEPTNGLENVFVVDRQQGTIELISRGANGDPADGGSSLPKISGDGRYVVFQSTAKNLVTDSANDFSDIFLFDRQTGTMRLVSVALDGGPSNGPSITPAISGDGQRVAFASRATNLVSQPTTGSFEQIFVTTWATPATVLASVNSAGTPGNGISFLPALNTDGSQVAFKSEAFNLVPNDTNGVPDVFVHDGATNTTQRVSVDSFGNQANGLSGGPGISGDGRFVAFPSFASNLVPEDGDGLGDVFVYDRFPPGRDQGLVARVTVGLDGTQPNGSVSDFPVTISADGRWIGFADAASNLVPNDFNNQLDAFLGCNPFDEFQCAPPTPTPTPPGTTPCIGDCDGDGTVTINELILMVNIALSLKPICPNDANGGCLAGDATCDCQITVDEIIRAVANLLEGCHDYGNCTIEEEQQMCCEGPPVSGTPTATRTPTPTPPVGPTTPDTPTVTPTTPGQGLCVGDCNGSGNVTIDDLVRMVAVALSLQSICPTEAGGGCLAGDSSCNCQITVDEIIQAVNNDLNGCTIFNTCPQAEHEAQCCG